MAVGCVTSYAFCFLNLLCPRMSPEASSFLWAVICPCFLSVMLPGWWGLGPQQGSSKLPHNQSERSLLTITTRNPCNTQSGWWWSSEQRTRAGINPGLSHGDGRITSGPALEDLILLRHRGHASLHSASLSFSSSCNKEIAKELRKVSPANTPGRATGESPLTIWDLLGRIVRGG